jgi:nucleoside-diphosphate-sugar epimerase
MAATKPKRIEDFRKTDDLLVVTGAGGFIAGALVRYFHDKDFRNIRAVDKKPLEAWYQKTPGVENLVLDVSFRDNCVKACYGAVEVYNLAADMGRAGACRG